MRQVKLQVEDKHFAEALLNLSQLYGDPDIPPYQAHEITRVLDQMAAKVIYSASTCWRRRTSSRRATPWIPSARATRCRARCWRINGIRGPEDLPPGRELKVIQGPFKAQISTEHSEMTLRLAERYAGRFPVVLSRDLSHATNLLTMVRDKRPALSAPGNGRGQSWIELGNASGSISMQGTNDTQFTNGNDTRNTIWRSEPDMDDVFGMLSIGSSVIIQR